MASLGKLLQWLGRKLCIVCLHGIGFIQTYHTEIEHLY
jgi:hypothetical protein